MSSHLSIGWGEQQRRDEDFPERLYEPRQRWRQAPIYVRFHPDELDHTRPNHQKFPVSSNYQFNFMILDFDIDSLEKSHELNKSLVG